MDRLHSHSLQPPVIPGEEQYLAEPVDHRQPVSDEASHSTGAPFQSHDIAQTFTPALKPSHPPTLDENALLAVYGITFIENMLQGEFFVNIHRKDLSQNVEAEIQKNKLNANLCMLSYREKAQGQINEPSPLTFSYDNLAYAHHILYQPIEHPEIPILRSELIEQLPHFLPQVKVLFYSRILERLAQRNNFDKTIFTFLCCLELSHLFQTLTYKTTENVIHSSWLTLFNYLPPDLIHSLLSLNAWPTEEHLMKDSFIQACLKTNVYQKDEIKEKYNLFSEKFETIAAMDNDIDQPLHHWQRIFGSIFFLNELPSIAKDLPEDVLQKAAKMGSALFLEQQKPTDLSLGDVLRFFPLLFDKPENEADLRNYFHLFFIPNLNEEDTISLATCKQIILISRRLALDFREKTYLLMILKNRIHPHAQSLFDFLLLHGNCLGELQKSFYNQDNFQMFSQSMTQLSMIEEIEPQHCKDAVIDLFKRCFWAVQIVRDLHALNLREMIFRPLEADPSIAQEYLSELVNAFFFRNTEYGSIVFCKSIGEALLRFEATDALKIFFDYTLLPSIETAQKNFYAFAKQITHPQSNQWRHILSSLSFILHSIRLARPIFNRLPEQHDLLIEVIEGMITHLREKIALIEHSPHPHISYQQLQSLSEYLSHLATLFSDTSQSLNPSIQDVLTNFSDLPSSVRILHYLILMDEAKLKGNVKEGQDWGLLVLHELHENCPSARSFFELLNLNQLKDSIFLREINTLLGIYLTPHEKKEAGTLPTTYESSTIISSFVQNGTYDASRMTAFLSKLATLRNHNANFLSKHLTDGPITNEKHTRILKCVILSTIAVIFSVKLFPKGITFSSEKWDELLSAIEIVPLQSRFLDWILFKNFPLVDLVEKKLFTEEGAAWILSLGMSTNQDVNTFAKIIGTALALNIPPKSFEILSLSLNPYDTSYLCSKYILAKRPFPSESDLNSFRAECNAYFTSLFPLFDEPIDGTPYIEAFPAIIKTINMMFSKRFASLPSKMSRKLQGILFAAPCATIEQILIINTNFLAFTKGIDLLRRLISDNKKIDSTVNLPSSPLKLLKSLILEKRVTAQQLLWMIDTEFGNQKLSREDTRLLLWTALTLSCKEQNHPSLIQYYLKGFLYFSCHSNEERTINQWIEHGKRFDLEMTNAISLAAKIDQITKELQEKEQEKKQQEDLLSKQSPCPVKQLPKLIKSLTQEIQDLQRTIQKITSKCENELPSRAAKKQSSLEELNLAKQRLAKAKKKISPEQANLMEEVTRLNRENLQLSSRLEEAQVILLKGKEQLDKTRVEHHEVAVRRVPSTMFTHDPLTNNPIEHPVLLKSEAVARFRDILPTELSQRVFERESLVQLIKEKCGETETDCHIIALQHKEHLYVPTTGMGEVWKANITRLLEHCQKLFSICDKVSLDGDLTTRYQQLKNQLPRMPSSRTSRLVTQPIEASLQGTEIAKMMINELRFLIESSTKLVLIAMGDQHIRATSAKHHHNNFLHGHRIYPMIAYIAQHFKCQNLLRNLRRDGFDDDKNHFGLIYSRLKTIHQAFLKGKFEETHLQEFQTIMNSVELLFATWESVLLKVIPKLKK